MHSKLCIICNHKNEFTLNMTELRDMVCLYCMIGYKMYALQFISLDLITTAHRSHDAIHYEIV